MSVVSKRLAPFARAEWILVTLLFAGLTPLVVRAQANDTAAQIAAAVLPLPESMRAGATVVSRGEKGAITVLRKGSNDMVCTADQPGDQTFYVNCFHESIFALMKRTTELNNELSRAGAPASGKALDVALDKEIKAGKFKLPSHPTIGFQMRGPLSGYNAATNTVSGEIKAWQMVMLPYETGASLSLPDKPNANMPWVMNAGTWAAHIMIEH